MMKRLACTVLLAIFCLSGQMAYSADREKGVHAYRKGSDENALKKWQPLAAQGVPEAQFQLGELYYRGAGVLQDYISAHMWANIAETN